jgi:hypothetical protein
MRHTPRNHPIETPVRPTPLKIGTTTASEAVAGPSSLGTLDYQRRMVTRVDTRNATRMTGAERLKDRPHSWSGPIVVAQEKLKPVPIVPLPCG